MDEENVVLESIDDFLPMPGADSVVSPDNDKPSFFSNAEETLDFLDEETEKEDEIPPLTDDIEEVKKTPGRKKVDKSGMVEIFSKLIEDKTILPFEGDDKKLEDYSLDDWKELIQENLNERERQIKEQTPKEFFEALPDELKAAAQYVAQGGTDLKGLFKVLSQVEETRTLDPLKEDDQEVIARQYLYATNFGKGDSTLIEEQLEEWMEAGLLEKKAKQFKPKLDEMQQEIIQDKLAQQETFKQQQLEKKETYMRNIYETLKEGELNGVKINAKRQDMLWQELTTAKYQSMTGKPTNLLGKLLEEYQFGKNPRYDLIAEALWLLQDPDDYKTTIKKQAEKAITEETVKKLKTEQDRKLSSTAMGDETEPVRGLQRKPKNIFSSK